MKRQFTFDRSSFLILYNQYREYLVSSIFLVLGLLLLLFLTIPSMRSLMAEKRQEKEYKTRIETMQNNLRFMELLDPRLLDSQVKLVSSVLPPDKDFVLILNAIAESKGNTGVSLGDFSFQVGSLATRSASVPGLPAIPVKLTGQGNIKNIESLLANLEQTVPISEVNTIQISGQSASFTVNFNYRLKSQLPFNPNLPIQPLSKGEEAVLNKMRSWHTGTSNNLPNPSYNKRQQSLPASSSSSAFF